MTLSYKYTIINKYIISNKYTLIIIILILLLLCYVFGLNWNKCLIEGLTDFEEYSHKIIPYPENTVINYNDINSPLYSHTVNLPINDPVSCKNFCGPKATCLLTGEQCTSDIDCYGCNSSSTLKDNCITTEVKPYDDTGKSGYNINFSQIYNGSKESKLTNSYQGIDLWTESFNKGLELYNKNREIADKYSNTKIQYYEPKYPLKTSLTGQFYETTPPASNIAL